MDTTDGELQVPGDTTTGGLLVPGDTTAGGLLVPGGIIRLVVSVNITESIPMLLNH